MNILETLLLFKGDAKPALEQMALMREGLGKVVDAHEKTRSSLLGGIVKAGAFAAVAAGIGLAVEGLHSGVEAFDEANVATTKLDTALKDNGTTLAAHQDEVDATQAKMRKLGFTNAETAGSLAALTLAGVPLNKSLADQSVIADLARSKNLSLADATEAIAKAANGRMSPALKEMGIHLGKGVTGTAALDSIMQQLHGKVAGQADAYSHTLPGALAILKTAWDNIAESIGQKVVPYIERFAQWITDHQDQIQSFVTGTLDALGTAFDVIGKAVGFVSDHATILTPILGGLISAFVLLKAAAAIQGLLALVSLGFDALGLSAAAATVAEWALTLPFLAIVAIIALVILGGYLLITHWEDIKRGAERIWGGIKDFIGGVWGHITDAVSTAFHKVIKWFEDLPGNLLHALGDLGNLLKDAGSKIIGGLLGGIKEKFEDVKNFVGGIGSWIGDHKGPLDYDRKLLIPHGKAIMGGLHAGLSDGFGQVQNLVSGMGDRLDPGGVLTGSVGAGGAGQNVTINNPTQTVDVTSALQSARFLAQAAKRGVSPTAWPSNISNPGVA